MAGYVNNPGANHESFSNGWFRTGDRGRIDADGYLYVTGRIKEIINRGGQKISPREIDELLVAHPAVEQAIAFPVPDPRLGEDIATAVILKGKGSISEHGLRSFVAERVAEYKVPRQIHFVDRIPTGPSGKVRRIDIAALFGKLGNDSRELPARVPYVAIQRNPKGAGRNLDERTRSRANRHPRRFCFSGGAIRHCWRNWCYDCTKLDGRRYLS